MLGVYAAVRPATTTSPILHHEKHTTDYTTQRQALHTEGKMQVKVKGGEEGGQSVMRVTRLLYLSTTDHIFLKQC